MATLTYKAENTGIASKTKIVPNLPEQTHKTQRTLDEAQRQQLANAFLNHNGLHTHTSTPASHVNLPDRKLKPVLPSITNAPKNEAAGAGIKKHGKKSGLPVMTADVNSPASLMKITLEPKTSIGELLSAGNVIVLDDSERFKTNPSKQDFQVPEAPPPQAVSPQPGISESDYNLLSAWYEYDIWLNEQATCDSEYQPGDLLGEGANWDSPGIFDILQQDDSTETNVLASFVLGELVEPLEMPVVEYIAEIPTDQDQEMPFFISDGQVASIDLQTVMNESFDINNAPDVEVLDSVHSELVQKMFEAVIHTAAEIYRLPEEQVAVIDSLEEKLEVLCFELLAATNSNPRSLDVLDFIKTLKASVAAVLKSTPVLSLDDLSNMGTHEHKFDHKLSPGKLIHVIKQQLQQQLRLGKYVLAVSKAQLLDPAIS